MSTPQYLLSLRDPKSGIVIQQSKTSGFIEIGINDTGVVFPIPIPLLTAFVTALGGQLEIPLSPLHRTQVVEGMPMGNVRLRALPASTSIIHCIKAIRAAHADVVDGQTLGLKETKHLVERARQGQDQTVFEGSITDCNSIGVALAAKGFPCDVNLV